VSLEVVILDSNEFYREFYQELHSSIKLSRLYIVITFQEAEHCETIDKVHDARFVAFVLNFIIRNTSA
jgi:flavorubredoxin